MFIFFKSISFLLMLTFLPSTVMAAESVCYSDTDCPSGQRCHRDYNNPICTTDSCYCVTPEYKNSSGVGNNDGFFYYNDEPSAGGMYGLVSGQPSCYYKFAPDRNMLGGGGNGKTNTYTDHNGVEKKSCCYPINESATYDEQIEIEVWGWDEDEKRCRRCSETNDTSTAGRQLNPYGCTNSDSYWTGIDKYGKTFSAYVSMFYDAEEHTFKSCRDKPEWQDLDGYPSGSAMASNLGRWNRNQPSECSCGGHGNQGVSGAIPDFFDEGTQVKYCCYKSQDGLTVFPFDPTKGTSGQCSTSGCSSGWQANQRGFCQKNCTTDSDCITFSQGSYRGENYSCIANRCTHESHLCADDLDCRAGETCSEGSCGIPCQQIAVEGFTGCLQDPELQTPVENATYDRDKRVYVCDYKSGDKANLIYVPDYSDNGTCMGWSKDACNRGEYPESGAILKSTHAGPHFIAEKGECVWCPASSYYDLERQTCICEHEVEYNPATNTCGEGGGGCQKDEYYVEAVKKCLPMPDANGADDAEYRENDGKGYFICNPNNRYLYVANYGEKGTCMTASEECSVEQVAEDPKRAVQVLYGNYPEGISFVRDSGRCVWCPEDSDYNGDTCVCHNGTYDMDRNVCVAGCDSETPHFVAPPGECRLCPEGSTYDSETFACNCTTEGWYYNVLSNSCELEETGGEGGEIGENPYDPLLQKRLYNIYERIRVRFINFLERGRSVNRFIKPEEE